MAYRQSAATLNLLRAFATGGYADLEHVHRWTLGFVKDCAAIDALSRSWPSGSPRRLDFMRAFGIDPETASGAAHDRFLHQPRGAAARLRAGADPRRIRPPATGTRRSGHMLWIGDRTRQPDDAHVEYLRGIKNPIGLKCGPSLERRRPAAPDRHAQSRQNEPGRLTLIGRFGADKVDDHLPRAGARGQAGGPHGRVVLRPDARQHRSRPPPATRRGPSTRSWREVQQLLRGPSAEGTYAGGVHVEMTGDERHRMHRRRRAPSPTRTCATATTPIATRASTPSRRSSWRSSSPS